MQGKGTPSFLQRFSGKASHITKKGPLDLMAISEQTLIRRKNQTGAGADNHHKSSLSTELKQQFSEKRQNYSPELSRNLKRAGKSRELLPAINKHDNGRPVKQGLRRYHSQYHSISITPMQSPRKRIGRESFERSNELARLRYPTADDPDFLGTNKRRKRTFSVQNKLDIQVQVHSRLYNNIMKQVQKLQKADKKPSY